VGFLATRTYLTADGAGRVETCTHPDRPDERVWACSSCGEHGRSEEGGRQHAAGHTTADRIGLFSADHF
jgi:hypothetical protein